MQQNNMTNTKSSTSNDHVCPHCNNLVPKMKLEVLGRTRYVQPNCDCEVEEQMRSVREAEKRIRTRKIESLFKISRMGSKLEHSTFENFINRDGTSLALAESKHFVETFDENIGIGMMLFGTPGGGKSHLAAAITHELLARKKSVVFQAVPELLERIRSTFNKNSRESEQQIMKALQQCDLLVLDDIGSERVTGWVYEIFFRIVDGRYRNEKPIIYTSNLTPKELEKRFSEFEDGDKIVDEQTPRILDRITETSDFIKVNATSYRKEIARQRIVDRRKEGVSNDH